MHTYDDDNCAGADPAGKDSAPGASGSAQRHPHRGSADEVEADARDRSC